MYNVSFPGLGIYNLSINPVALSINGLNIRWYGIIITAGLILAIIYAQTVCKKRFGVDKDKLFNCTIVGIITAIIGARLYYVIFQWDTYSKNPMKIFNINEGGLAIYGGLIGALIGGLIVAKLNNMNIPALLDVAVLGFLIGQGIGRWGNFTNQEAFGTPTHLPWGMVSENTGGVAVHPCFLYESLWCLLGFVVLHILSKYRRKYDGQIFIMYLIWYGFERMIVEGFRTDSLMLPILNIRISQALSVLLLITGVTVFIINCVRNKDNIEVPPIKYTRRSKA